MLKISLLSYLFAQWHDGCKKRTLPRRCIPFRTQCCRSGFARSLFGTALRLARLSTLSSRSLALGSPGEDMNTQYRSPNRSPKRSHHRSPNTQNRSPQFPLCPLDELTRVMDQDLQDNCRVYGRKVSRKSEEPGAVRGLPKHGPSRAPVAAPGGGDGDGDGGGGEGGGGEGGGGSEGEGGGGEGEGEEEQRLQGCLVRRTSATASGAQKELLRQQTQPSYTSHGGHAVCVANTPKH